MNIEEYISSGILECYVLGQLSRSEAAKVEEIAAQYPEVKKEITAIEVQMESYALAHAKTPPPGSKAKLMAQLDAEIQGSKTIKIYKSNKIPYYYAAASTLFAMIFGAAAFYYFSELQIARSEVASLRLESQRMASVNNVVNKEMKDQLAAKDLFLSFLKDTSTKAVQLKGLPLSPSSVAMVFWNKQAQSVYLDVKSLPTPPADKQYQLWALKDGVPVDAGVFDVATSTLPMQKMKNIDGAQAFAVTLETKGGNASPTMDQMYLIGKI